MDEAPKTKPTEGEQSGKNESHLSNAESEREKYNKLSRSRHNREWKGLVRDAVNLLLFGALILKEFISRKNPIAKTVVQRGLRLPDLHFKGKGVDLMSMRIRRFGIFFFLNIK